MGESPLDDEASFETICARLEADWAKPLRAHVGLLLWRRHVHEQFRGLLVTGAVPPGDLFWDNFHSMYLDAQLLAIRRLVDADSRTLSLHRLLGQVERHRRKLTRAEFVSRYVASLMPPNDEDPQLRAALIKIHTDHADQAFDQFTTTSKPGFASAVDQDRRLLNDVTHDLVSAADSFVAHIEKGAAPTTATYDSLDHAVTVIDKIVCKYSLLVSGSAPETTLPTGQSAALGFLQELVDRGR